MTASRSRAGGGPAHLAVIASATPIATGGSAAFRAASRLATSSETGASTVKWSASGTSR